MNITSGILLISLLAACVSPFAWDAHWFVESIASVGVLASGLAIAERIENRRLQLEYRKHACSQCGHRLDWSSAHDAEGNCKPVPSVTYPLAKIS